MAYCNLSIRFMTKHGERPSFLLQLKPVDQHSFEASLFNSGKTSLRDGTTCRRDFCNGFLDGILHNFIKTIRRRVDQCFVRLQFGPDTPQRLMNQNTAIHCAQTALRRFERVRSQTKSGEGTKRTSGLVCKNRGSSAPQSSIPEWRGAIVDSLDP